MLHAGLGVLALLVLAFACSENRRKIHWRTVIGGVGLQIIFALLLIGIPGTNKAMFWLNDAANALHDATLTGTLDDPKLEGQAAIASGQFNDAATGLKLTNVSLAAQLDQSSINVGAFTGQDNY